MGGRCYTRSCGGFQQLLDWTKIYGVTVRVSFYVVAVVASCLALGLQVVAGDHDYRRHVVAVAVPFGLGLD